jgi:hypothetical protein
LLVGALFALAVAGCGQPPPSNDSQSGGGGNEVASEEATGGETTAEETAAEETTTEETTAEGTVSEETTGAVAVGGSPELAAAADGYEEYVVEQVTLLEERTEGFTDAVISGDVDEAKSTGPAGRQNLACCQSPRRNPPSPYPIRVKIAHSGDAPRRSRVRCPRDRDGEEVVSLGNPSARTLYDDSGHGLRERRDGRSRQGGARRCGVFHALCLAAAPLLRVHARRRLHQRARHRPLRFSSDARVLGLRNRGS